VLDVPLELCQAQNPARVRRVAPEIVAIHYQQFERARATLPTEGYAAPHRVPRCSARDRAPAIRNGV
jgi:predicted kinase